MKTNPLLSLLAVLISFNGSAQSTYTKTYGGINYDVFHGIAATADGGSIMTGLSMSSGDTLGNVSLVKIDSSGNMIFTKSFGGNDLDGGNAIIQTADGGYLIVGHSESFGNDCQGIIIRTNADGDSLWGGVYGNPDDEALSAVEETADGGFILSGYTENYGADGLDILLIKIDGNGSVQWQRNIGGVGDQVGNSVHQSTDGGYIIGGITRVMSGGDEDVLLVKTNDSGQVGWTKTFGGNADDIAYRVRQTTEGGYIVCGGSASSGGGMLDFYLVKTDDSGNLQWQTTYGGTNDEVAHDVLQIPAGGYLLTGYTRSFGDSLNDIYLVKAGDTGNKEWVKVIGNPVCDDYAIGIVPAISEGYMIAGNTDCFGYGGEDGYVVKINAEGEVVTGIHALTPPGEMVIMPNPNNGSFVLEYSSQKSGPVKISLMDLTGEITKEITTGITTRDLRNQVEWKDVAPGLYFLTLESSDGWQVKKMVIQ